jgi:hypothetical protein
MPNGRTVWIRVLTFGGFVGWLVGILGFFGIDAKTLTQMMTAHYLFLLLTVASFVAFGWGSLSMVEIVPCHDQEH